MEAHADARVVIASSAAALPDYAMGDQYGHGQGSPPRFDLHHLRCATVYVSDWVYLLLLPVSLTYGFDLQIWQIWPWSIELRPGGR